MAHITDDEIKKLARLSRLSLDEAQIVSLREDVGEILEYVGKLSRVDTGDVQEVHGGGGGTNVFREDTPSPASPELRSALVSSFPTKSNDSLKVPPVLTGGKSV